MANTAVGPTGFSDEELLRRIQAGEAPPTLPIQTLMPVAAAGLSDEEMANAIGESAPPQVDSSISTGNLARQALSGVTFGLDDEIVGGARETFGAKGAIEEERRRKAAFEKEHPVVSFLTKGAGAVAGSLTPASWLARIGATGRLARAALPIAETGRIAGASVPQAVRAGAELGAKGALWQSFGDAEGGLGARAATVAENAPANIAFGGTLGAGFGYLGRGGANIANSLEDAARVGVGPDAAAVSVLRDATTQGGTRTVENIIDDMVVRNNLTRTVPADHARAVVDAYGATLSNGGTRQAAEAAAQAAYANLNPVSQTGAPLAAATIRNRANALTRSFSENFTQGGPPMVAAERISGAQRPLGGQMKSVVRGVMNSPGDGLDIARRAITPRQEGAMDRVRSLVSDEIGDTDYTNYIRGLQDTSRHQQNISYGLSRQFARPFDIQPAIARHTEVARRTFGDPGRNLNAAGQDVIDWWQRIPRPTGNEPPEVQRQMLGDMINSYKQVRRSIENSAQQLVREGDRESARYLRQFKRDLDARVALPNRTWWRANRMAADDFRIQEAADMGRTVSLNEGAALQNAKDWYRNANQVERNAFRRGFARQLHDKVSRMGDMHDPGKAFLTGSDVDDEGMRGLVTMVLGPRDGRRFLRQIERERTALSTYNLDKGPYTASVLQEAQKRNAGSQLATAMNYAVNPLSILEGLASRASQAAGEARDTALARRLFSTSEGDFIALMRELGQAQAPPSHRLQDALSRIPESATVIAPGAFGTTEEEARYQ